MPNSSLYSIDCFNTEYGLGAGRYGPVIVLAKEAVQAILAAEKRNADAPMMEMLAQRVAGSFRHGKLWAPNFTFYKDTWLLRTFQVPGNCACIGIDGNELRHLGTKNVRYNPHNIDSPEQSACVLSTWLLWFNTLVVLTDLRLPYAM